MAFDPATIKVPAHIENPSAYRAAVARQIAARQQAAQQKRASAKMVEWMTEERAVLIGRLAFECKRGNFEFYHSLHNAFHQWGCLTENQEAALERAFQKQDARKKEREAENAAAAVVSKHVGMVKARANFRLRLVSQVQRDGFAGSYMDMTLEDESGNRFRCAGNSLAMEPGQLATVKATVVGHDEWHGVKVTRINRPVLVPDALNEADFLATRFSAGGKGIKL